MCHFKKKKKTIWDGGERREVFGGRERGEELELVYTIYKSDLEPTFQKVSTLIIFISMPIKEYPTIFSTLGHLKNHKN